MRLKRTLMSALASSLLAALFAATPADAAEGGWWLGDSPSRALVAADVLNLRAAPSVDARVVTQIPLGSGVEVLDSNGPPVTAGGQASHWVRVKISRCSFTYCSYCSYEQICYEDMEGWAVDSFLAYEDRLEAMTAWRPGALRAAAGDHRFGYDIAADGTFSFWITCGGTDICSDPGRMYRYRDLVVLKGDVVYEEDNQRRYFTLYIDGAGNLCFIQPSEVREYERRCDR